VLSSRERYGALVEEIRAEFPSFRIVAKRNSRIQHAIHTALYALTLGRMRSYLSSYHTTIGATVYVPDGWEEQSYEARYLVLRHERVHLRQFRRLTVPGMAFVYLLLPLPMGLSYFRARLEKEAYAETIRATAELYGLAEVRSPPFRERIVEQFLGAAYGWMWPFRRQVERWYDRIVESIG
jgi:hypothetical protein